jgi:hypothetical protein
MNNDTKLKVWWIPQVPMKPFEVDVSSVEEGVKIMEVLAKYDLFQYQNDVKPDYSNAGGIMMIEDGEWTDWYDEETGCDDPEEYLEMRGNHA